MTASRSFARRNTSSRHAASGSTPPNTPDAVRSTVAVATIAASSNPGFRLLVENVADSISRVAGVGHEVLAAVLRVRGASLQVMLWERAREPHAHRWSLPGGGLRVDEDVETSIRRQLTEKVDVRQLSHVEQLAVFSAPDRVPGPRVVATAFLGLVPSDADPAVPADTRWHPVEALPRTAFDHESIVRRARDRLRAKLSYTNIGFALAPPTFTISALRGVYSAALGYRVSATNLQRV